MIRWNNIILIRITKIKVLKSPSFDKYYKSEHLVKANESNNKVKFVKITEKKDFKNYQPIKLKSISMSVKGSNDKVEVYKFNDIDNLLEKVNVLNYPIVDDKHREIKDFEIMNKNLDLDLSMNEFSSLGYKFEDLNKNKLNLQTAKDKFASFAPNEFSFMIKVSNSDKTNLKAELEFKGEDAFGNTFESKIKNEDW